MPLNLSELTELERLYLGLLALGLVPSRLANDPSYRLDYLTAVCYAMTRDEPATAYLRGDGPDCQPEFMVELRRVLRSLEEKGVISLGMPPPGMGLLALDDPNRWQADWATVDLDITPRIVDRFLAHECLDALLNHRQVYTFLMGKYADSSEVWQRLVASGYGDQPGP